MPIVDISGLSEHEAEAKVLIRSRIQALYQERLGTSLTATTVTFFTDKTAGSGPSVHVMARLYSKMFMKMKRRKLKKIADAIVHILEEEGGHTFNEAFPIPVMAMRGGTKPYKPKT